MFAARKRCIHIHLYVQINCSRMWTKKCHSEIKSSKTNAQRRWVGKRLSLTFRDDKSTMLNIIWRSLPHAMHVKSLGDVDDAVLSLFLVLFFILFVAFIVRHFTHGTSYTNVHMRARRPSEKVKHSVNFACNMPNVWRQLWNACSFAVRHCTNQRHRLDCWISIRSLPKQFRTNEQNDQFHICQFSFQLYFKSRNKKLVPFFTLGFDKLI